MTEAQLEQLLNEEEGPTLDFKRDQYAFAKASAEEKSELLKDILGMANAWRRSEAYILIGVEEVRGGRSTIHGILASDHLADHSLQQFLNSLTNRPLQFGYEAREFDGKQIGIISVAQQPRPFYLKQDYGKLKMNEVYVRRGSSTDPTKPASPDEIFAMGRAVEVVLADLYGLELELNYNKRLARDLVAVFTRYISEHGLGTNVSKPNPVTPQRFRLHAVQAFLQRPFLADAVLAKEFGRYWEIGSLCNGMMDKVAGLTTVAVVDDVVATVIRHIPEIDTLNDILAAKMTSLKC